HVTGVQTCALPISRDLLRLAERHALTSMPGIPETVAENTAGSGDPTGLGSGVAGRGGLTASETEGATDGDGQTKAEDALQATFWGGDDGSAEGSGAARDGDDGSVEVSGVARDGGDAAGAVGVARDGGGVAGAVGVAESGPSGRAVRKVRVAEAV